MVVFATYSALWPLVAPAHHHVNPYSLNFPASGILRSVCLPVHVFFVTERRIPKKKICTYFFFWVSFALYASLYIFTADTKYYV